MRGVPCMWTNSWSVLFLIRQLSALLAHPTYLSPSPKFRWAVKMLPCFFHCPMESVAYSKKGGEGVGGNGLGMGELNREQNARKTSPVNHNSTNDKCERWVFKTIFYTLRGPWEYRVNLSVTDNRTAEIWPSINADRPGSPVSLSFQEELWRATLSM